MAGESALLSTIFALVMAVPLAAAVLLWATVIAGLLSDARAVRLAGSGNKPQFSADDRRFLHDLHIQLR